jgi:glycosyltransferase involved in cell wall biosynthesis
MARLRVLLVMHELTRTGAPLLALRSHVAMAPSVDVRTVSRAGGPLEPDFRALGPTLVLRRGPIAPGPLGRVRGALAMVGATRPGGWQPEVIHVNSAAALPVYQRMYGVRALRRPVLLHVHESRDYLGSVERHFPGLIAGVPDAWIGVSSDVEDALVSRFGIPPGRITVIPPHIDPRWLEARADGVDGDTGRDGAANPIVIGGAGEPSWRKGTELWLLAAAELQRRAGDGRYRFLWVGLTDNDHSRQMRAMVEKLGLVGIVELVPQTAETAAAYRRMDILLATPWEEPAGIVVLELMALGRPVVCVAGSGGPAEEVGQAGVVVDGFDVGSIADAVERVASSPDLRLSLGRAARDRVSECYTTPVLAPLVLEALQRTAALPGRRRASERA